MRIKKAHVAQAVKLIVEDHKGQHLDPIDEENWEMMVDCKSCKCDEQLKQIVDNNEDDFYDLMEAVAEGTQDSEGVEYYRNLK